MLSIQSLNSTFEYRNGSLFWKISPRQTSIPVGQKAGSMNEFGRVQVSVDGKNYLVHRLIWTMFKGGVPAGMDIDHKDLDPSNNLIDNLRLATKSQNAQNCKARKTNAAKLKGVCFYPRTQKWVSKIRIDGKQIHLGYFTSPESAHEAYQRAAASLFKEFARFG